MSSLPFSSTLFRPSSGGLTAAGPVLCPASLDNWLLDSTLEKVLVLVGGAVDLVKGNGLGGLEVAEGGMEVVGEILGVADIDELEAGEVALGSTLVDELKAGGVALGSVAVDEVEGREVVEGVLELMGVVVALLEVVEEDGSELVLGEGAEGGDRGVVGGGGAPLGVADGVPWVDETVGGVVDLVKGELAAGLLPADLGGEGLREGGAGGERSGGPAGGPRNDDLCLAGAGWLVCTVCDGPEGTSWLLTGLNEAPTSSHTSFRR